MGLGKTIEAGLVIRQHLIDDPTTTIVVVTPKNLVEQWKEDLLHKLALHQFEDNFECISYEELGTIEETPDVLVVDEAHNIVGNSLTKKFPKEIQLINLSSKVSVLLLLSATPPLRDNEEKYFRLLNLLDPVSYPLDQIDGFKKLKDSQEIGRILIGLRHDAKSLVLRSRCSQLKESWPEDAILNDLCDQILGAIDENLSASTKLFDYCNRLRGYVCDKYRVFHRLIRSRREDCLGWEFNNRGPEIKDDIIELEHIEVEEFDSTNDNTEIMQAIFEWLEDARNFYYETETHKEKIIAVTKRY